MTVSLDNGLTFAETLSNPFRSGMQEPVGAAQGVETFLGQTITYFDPDAEVAARCSAGRSACSASCRDAGSPTSAYVGNHGTRSADVAQPQRDAEPVPEHQPDARSGDDRLSSAPPCPNPFVNLMPATAGTAFRAADHRARAAAAAVSAVRRHEHHDERRAGRRITRCRPACRSGSSRATRSARTTPTRASWRRPSS